MKSHDHSNGDSSEDPKKTIRAIRMKLAEEIRLDKASGDFNPSKYFERMRIECPNAELLDALSQAAGDAKVEPVGEALKVIARQLSESKKDSQGTDNAAAPLEINEAILWHVLQAINDEFDPSLKRPPSGSMVFLRLCRDKMSLAGISRKFKWSNRTLKDRKAKLESFLRNRFNGMTFEMFMGADTSIFRAAERQLEDHRARRISPHALAEREPEQEDD